MTPMTTKTIVHTAAVQAGSTAALPLHLSVMVRFPAVAPWTRIPPRASQKTNHLPVERDTDSTRTRTKTHLASGSMLLRLKRLATEVATPLARRVPEK